MKILLTGGAGYIGSHCNKYLIENGIETVILDDLSSGHEEAVCGGRLIVGDLGDRELLGKIFMEEGIDGVLHFAALADVADSVADPSKYYETNICKMKILLDTMVKYNVKKIIFSSSAAIFGEPEYIPIDEEHTKEPINPYGMTKLVGEKMLLDYEKAYGIRFCAMRYFNAAGADATGIIGESHNPEHHILPLIFMTALGERKKFSVYGSDYSTIDGTCIRDYIHVEDLAAAHYLALMYLNKGGKSDFFNLGNGKGYSILEIISSFEKISGQKLNFDFADRRWGDPASLVASYSKAQSVLGWTPDKSNMTNVIKSAWNWQRRKKY